MVTAREGLSSTVLLKLGRKEAVGRGNASRSENRMGQELPPDMAIEIEIQAARVQRLAERGAAIKLDRLRDETAALQCLIAEAASIERRAER